MRSGLFIKFVVNRSGSLEWPMIFSTLSLHISNQRVIIALFIMSRDEGSLWDLYTSHFFHSLNLYFPLILARIIFFFVCWHPSCREMDWLFVTKCRRLAQTEKPVNILNSTGQNGSLSCSIVMIIHHLHPSLVTGRTMVFGIYLVVVVVFFIFYTFFLFWLFAKICCLYCWRINKKILFFHYHWRFN